VLRQISCSRGADWWRKVAKDAFAVIRDTIAKMNMVAIGRVALTRREHIIALEPKGRGIVGLTLRYPYEVQEGTGAEHAGAAAC
jgi:non-homologous end joining protein Ku